MQGLTYPQKELLTEKEFNDYFLPADGFLVRRADSPENELLGAFYIKKNFPGRCSHICNAGFLVKEGWRGYGIGRFMGETMLKLAKHNCGFEAVMFNLVFKTNVASVRLWAVIELPNHRPNTKR